MNARRELARLGEAIFVGLVTAVVVLVVLQDLAAKVVPLPVSEPSAGGAPSREPNFEIHVSGETP